MGLIAETTDSSHINLLKIGGNAPDFTLPSHLGEDWRLSSHLGKVIALLFYPQNETLVCTRQLCSIRDSWADYLATKALIVGISPGKIEEHQQFAEKFRLPMPLLVDEGRKITKMFGQHQWLPLSLTRAIVIIDAKGFIRHKKATFRGFRPTDYSILTSIYQAQTDASQDKFNEILKRHREKRKSLDTWLVR
jgi:peroxiredoxin Q/BCP